MLLVNSYLINTWKVLDDEAKKNASKHTPSHLQYTSQQVVPGGAYNQSAEIDTQIIEPIVLKILKNE